MKFGSYGNFGSSIDVAVAQPEEAGVEIVKHRPDLDELVHTILNDVIDQIPNQASDEKSIRVLAKEKVTGSLDHIIQTDGRHLSYADKQRVIKSVENELFHYGPITSLLEDDTISEVMVNGPKEVFVEKRGRLTRVENEFRDDKHVMHIIDKIIAPIGRRVDESSPLVDARLPDGSRVNIIIPPLAIKGPTITIRKFSRDPLTVNDLVSFGTLTNEAAKFLSLCVRGRMNVLVSGGTGSGKTTLLNVLSSFIPANERIVTIEDAAEVQLQQPHVVTLESRPANLEGKGRISIRDLVVNSLRMRPDRIIIGEVRGGEALDMLQAMNTGHDGSLTTIHANTPRDSLSRMETLVLMSGVELPARAIREQVASAIQVVVQTERLLDGSRKVTKVSEISGMEGETVTLQDIFVFQQTGLDEKGKIIGSHQPTGVIPSFISKIEAKGETIPPGLFTPRSAGSTYGKG